METRGNKSFKICNVLGGLDVTRYVSGNTRHLFQQAIEDVELVREYISQAASNRMRSPVPFPSSDEVFEQLSESFQWKERGYSKPTTSVEANFGAYADDSPDRPIDIDVFSRHEPFVGDKATDAVFAGLVENIFPWIVDRRSVEEAWWLPHQNGRSEGPEKEGFVWESTLYTAAWLGTYGEVWAYYPPFWVFGEGHPMTVRDSLGPSVETHDFPFVKPNIPPRNPHHRAFLRDPYPDVARPGLSLISALAPVYFTGKFGNYAYNHTYMASTGLDIAVSSVSSILDVLLDSLTEISFAVLVNSHFGTVVLSDTVVKRLYPARTGFEDSRVVLDQETKEILEDRRNQTYTVADTIHQDLTNLTNADWNGLLDSVLETPRGDRDFTKLNITLTGEENATEFYVMFERWMTQADWVMLVFAPVSEVDDAIDVVLRSDMESDNATEKDRVEVEGQRGSLLGAYTEVFNRGDLDVTITARKMPSWLSLSPPLIEKELLRAGESLPLHLQIDTTSLELGTSALSLALNIQDDEYPDCFYKQDISIPVIVRVNPTDCVEFTGDRLSVSNAAGQCVCSAIAVEISSRCWSQLFLVILILIPIMAIGLTAMFMYLEKKRKQADSVWLIKTSDLIFNDPPEVLGRGTFGLVVLAEYRGTQVAVKRVIPPRQKTAKVRKPENSKSGSAHFDFRDANGAGKPMLKRRGSVGGNTIERPKMERRRSAGHLGDHFPMQRRASIDGYLGVTGSKTSNGENGHPPPDMNGRAKRRASLTSLFANQAMSLENSNSGIFGRPSPTNVPMRIGRTKSSSRSRSTASSQAGSGYDKLKADFINEMRLLSKLRHPCITTVMGAVISRDEEPLLVMEYMDHGSLFDLLHNETILLEGDTLLPILRDISQGLRFLHAANPQVIHGDVKSANVLVDGKFRAKVADFGLSQKKQVGATGTPLWMAPELLRGDSLNTAESDVYSFGIVLYEVYSRQLPYDDDEEDDFALLQLICDPYINKRPPVPKSMPSDVATLMIECLDAHADLRPTFGDIDSRLKDFNVGNVEPGKVAHSMQMKKQMDAATSLLHEIFPKHIAETLSSGRRVEPEHFECVTIFFSDIVGFTTISSDLSPLKVSDMLDRLYLKFDALSREHDVFKVETIGDAWMGVTNLAKAQPDHAKRIADFASDAVIAASETMIDTDDPSKGYVNIRVGFHSGPVVANVVGTTNPRYTLIGDTVNTASRMESNSASGRILCSDRSAKLIMRQGPQIPLKYRGKIEVKGKGEMATFWVWMDTLRDSRDSDDCLSASGSTYAENNRRLSNIFEDTASSVTTTESTPLLANSA